MLPEVNSYGMRDAREPALESIHDDLGDQTLGR